MASLKVSIIINNYNYGHFLREAIDSSLNQTYSNCEVIVVDDGSKDRSHHIITGYGDRILSVLKQNGGQASALNAGFEASSGKIVIFLDADDYLLPQAVARIVAVWKSNTAKLHYRLRMVDVRGTFLGTHPPQSKSLDRGEVWSTLLSKGRYVTPVTSGNAFSRAILEKILPIPEVSYRIAADDYLTTLAPFFGSVLALEEMLGVYRIHGQNLWALGTEFKIEQFQKFVEHDFQRYKLLQQMASQIPSSSLLSKDCETIDFSCPVDPKNQSLLASGIHLGNHDYLHLQHRIVSLRLAPYQHPLNTDTGFFLIKRGIWAIWQSSYLHWSKQWLFSAWFVWVGLMPQSLAKIAIVWLFVQPSRPRSLRWLLQAWRRMNWTKTSQIKKQTRLLSLYHQPMIALFYGIKR